MVKKKNINQEAYEKKEKAYVDQLINELMEFEKTLSPTGEPKIIAHFFEGKNYPWKSFCILMKKYLPLENAFSLVCHKLLLQWFHYALRSSDLPRHKLWLIQKYILAYDPYLYMLQKEMKDDRIRTAIHEIYQRETELIDK